MRIGPELAQGGLTVAEQAARQLALYGELTAGMPAGAGRAVPVRIGVTQNDLDDLAVVPRSGTAPLRVGVVKPIPGAVGKPFGKAFNHGVVQANADGSLVWALQVGSPGAQAIRLHFTNFSLPTDTAMYFMSSTGQAFGPYEGRGRNGDGDFWTRSVASDSGWVILRYGGNTPDLAQLEMSFVISDVAHIRGRPPRPQERSHDTWPCSDNAACLLDVNCVDAGAATAAEDAIAKMEWIQGPFIYTCSGGLLADTDPGTQTPYFLTANHCLSASNSNLETFFNYTTDSCDGGCPDSLVTGGTPPPASTVGVTLVATATHGDFTLLTLDDPPPAGAMYLGWDHSPIANTNGAHLYRISNPNFGPQVYSQHDVDTSSPQCTGWPRGERIYSVDRAGATMGGSSGSPVLNAAGQVVGQLSGCCGYDCSNVCDSSNNWTVDGALAFYWDSVSQFLDPLGGGGCASDLECDDGLFCTGSETCAGGSCQSSGDPCSGGAICNESTNSCDAPACDNDGACEAGENCSNCPNDCRQKSAGNPKSRYCCDGNLSDCGNAACSQNGWSCGSGGGACATDADCNDGQFCNGVETCSGGSCQSGSSPCPGQSCDESTDQCVTCGGNRTACTSNSDCCSNSCRGGSCKGN